MCWPKSVESKRHFHLCADANALRGKLTSILDSLGIATETIEHEEAFTIEQLMPHLESEPGAVAKNLFLRDKKKRLWLLSCRHDRQLNLNDVARAIGTKDLRFADEEVLVEKLGVRQGCVSAFALMEDAEDKSVAFAVDEALVDVLRLSRAMTHKYCLLMAALLHWLKEQKSCEN